MRKLLMILIVNHSSEALIKESNQVDIKAELHKLVDGLDEEKYKNNKTLWNIGQGHSVSGLVTNLLSENQKPVEKTLKEKLEEMGFKEATERFYWKNKICVAINEWTAFIHSEQPLIGTQTLINDIRDHDQIFADIAYLENKYAKKSDTL